MSRFNLLNEKWIRVIRDYKGNTEEVSLIELFENAHFYIDLGGETKAQDFAVLRFLLAVLHTVFSRFNAQGDEYGYVDLDDRFKPTSQMDEWDVGDYADDLLQTWQDLWNDKDASFPSIITEYLQKWKDRFNLYDDKYPFYQVRAVDIRSENTNKKKKKNDEGLATFLSGKRMNRLISESNNKVALFSPKLQDEDKNCLSDAQIARWLLAYHGYAGVDDKTKFIKYNGNEITQLKLSKGHLLNLGGIYVRGDNLKQTLLLNLVLCPANENQLKVTQNPCWENSPSKNLEQCLFYTDDEGYISPDNVAQVYTNWSKAVYIDPENTSNEDFKMQIVKLSAIDTTDQFMENMTLWRYNAQKNKSGYYIPKMHKKSESLWRNFGLIAFSVDAVESSKTASRKPNVIDWVQRNSSAIGDVNLSICAISMEQDPQPANAAPIDMIYDELNINNFVLGDIKDVDEKKGRAIRVNDAVNTTKYVMGAVFGRFLSNIMEIRNIVEDKDNEENSYKNKNIEQVYFLLNTPFRKWLSNLDANSNMDEEIKNWNGTLKKILLNYVENNIVNSNLPRDYKGVLKNDKMLNLPIAYNRFLSALNKAFR